MARHGWQVQQAAEGPCWLKWLAAAPFWVQSWQRLPGVWRAGRVICLPVALTFETWVTSASQVRPQPGELQALVR